MKSNRASWLLFSMILGNLWLLSFISLADNHAQQLNPQQQQDNKLDPSLEYALGEAEAGDRLDIILYLEGQAEIGLLNVPEDKPSRRNYVANVLQDSSANNQAPVLAQLQVYERDGRAELKRSLWIINALQVDAEVEIIDDLVAIPEVKRAAINTKHQFISPTEHLAGLQPETLSWGSKRIRANYVWSGLGIDGSGVVVAIMDTGVDWTHPALQQNYRGNLGNDQTNHKGNWFDAVDANPRPIDPHGHGTHVAGTAIGGLGIGVAPGSQWIAVRILDDQGYGTIADIHAGFQWLLAPGGNPARSPDIVNNSWAGSPEQIEFMPDVAALRAAGIIPIFAAGNDGPEIESIGSPANFPGTIAVGASDDLDLVAWFSSRGPSPYTAEFKPTFVAPGTEILSSLPDARYGYLHGTSMAAPHVTGLYALLFSAQPTLNEKELTALIKDSALPIGTSVPNYDSGWGRIDAYEALVGVVDGGAIHGRLRSESTMLPNTTISITAPNDENLTFQTGFDGEVVAKLKPGAYAVSANPFGFVPFLKDGIVVSLDQTTNIDINLHQLPYGEVSGRVLDKNNKPVIADIMVSNTPVKTQTNDGGYYQIQLPAGQYQISVIANGYRVNRKTVLATPGTVTTQRFSLTSAPRILVVDSGKWYFNSQINYFTIALDQNDFAYDLWSVRNPVTEVPASEILSGYDVVIWSSPLDSPGQLGAGEAVFDYLDQGGRLLISGQNIAALDGGPLFEPWWYAQIHGRFLGDAQEPYHLTGIKETVFDDMSLDLNGSDSANNQTTPDKSQPTAGGLTEAIFTYPDGSAAGLQAHRCEPFRALYFGFGFEGVGGAMLRSEIIARSMEFLSQPETEVGIYFSPNKIEELVPTGSRRSFDVKIINLSETITDTIQLSIKDSTWSSSITTSTLTLGPCESGRTTLQVAIPNNLPIHSTEQFRLIAKSKSFPGYSEEMEINFKIPGYILLVDDDRWYDQEAVFRSALDEAGVSYDFWNIEEDLLESKSPPTDLLNAYDMVLWYTGYDWFEPITHQESKSIRDFLAGGGRLFLTSQDYLYYHRDERLAKVFFGVEDYIESIEPSKVYGGDQFGFGSHILSPIFLDFGLYKNFSDGLIPTEKGQIFLWDNKGTAAALATSAGKSRTLFMGFPFETLPQEDHQLMIQRILGWMSDLGDSSFEVDNPSSATGMDPRAIRTYTITLRSVNGALNNRVTMTNTLPPDLELNVASIRGGAIYDPELHQLNWNGNLKSGASHEISYQARVASGLSVGHQVENRVTLQYDRHGIHFDIYASTWVDSADLNPSYLVLEPLEIRPNQIASVEIGLVNDGLSTALISSTVFIPELLKPITGTLFISTGTAEWDGNHLLWKGDLRAGESTTLRFSVVSGVSESLSWLPVTLLVDDGVTRPIFRNNIIRYIPYQYYFPRIEISAD